MVDPTGTPPDWSPSPEGFGEAFPLDAEWLTPDDGVHLPPVVDLQPVNYEPSPNSPEQGAYREELAALAARGVTQDRLGSPWGTCTEAAWATVLGVSLDTLPDIRAWAESRGASTQEVDQALDLRWGLLQQFVLEHLGVMALRGDGSLPPGLAEKRVREEQLGYPLAPMIWVAGGPGPRGFPHAVVYADDQLAWDPHPHRNELNRVTGWTIFVPMGIYGLAGW